MEKIVLASQSPRRKQLLEWAEVPFDIVVTPTPETVPSGSSPAEAAQHIARQKAPAVLPQIGNRLVLAADTIVVLGNDIIGKPTNREDAINILQRLSGNHHQVITGVVMMRGETELLSFADITDVHFHALSTEQIQFYVDKYQPYDKAGAYAIQEWIGVVGIQKVAGDFYNVMGLPVSRVVQALQRFAP